VRLLPVVALLLAACASSREPAASDGHFGVFYDRREEGEESVTQVRPFYFKREDHRGKAINILGPLIRYRVDESFRRIQVIPAGYYTARHSPEEEKSWFFMIFPLFAVGTNDFFVLPFGGYSDSILGIDHLLAITPLYMRMRFVRGPPANPITYTVHHILFPILAWGSDDQPNGRRKFRFAPFYGRTRGRDGSTRGFVMWPFYTWRREGERRSFFIFPFYGRDVSPTREHTTVMFPFYFRTVDHQTGLKDTTLFPFYRRAKGSDRTEVRRYWPFYQYARDRTNLTTFIAWPVWRRQYVDTEREFLRWTWVMPPFYRKLRSFRRADGAQARKTVIWPIGRWERHYDGYRETAFPVIWPWDGPAIRDWSEPWRPFVSIWRRRTWPSGSRETTALFGLYMARRTPETKKVRLAWGILGWDDRGRDGTHLRLFWALRLRLSKPS